MRSRHIHLLPVMDVPCRLRHTQLCPSCSRDPIVVAVLLNRQPSCVIRAKLGTPRDKSRGRESRMYGTAVSKHQSSEMAVDAAQGMEGQTGTGRAPGRRKPTPYPSVRAGAPVPGWQRSPQAGKKGKGTGTCRPVLGSGPVGGKKTLDGGGWGRGRWRDGGSEVPSSSSPLPTIPPCCSICPHPCNALLAYPGEPGYGNILGAPGMGSRSLFCHDTKPDDPFIPIRLLIPAVITYNSRRSPLFSDPAPLSFFPSTSSPPSRPTSSSDRHHYSILLRVLARLAPSPDSRGFTTTLAEDTSVVSDTTRPCAYLRVGKSRPVRLAPQINTHTTAHHGLRCAQEPRRGRGPRGRHLS
ncbi:hypothetical protein QBC39DRAFT_338961 [Podospora conica]|nr:hypothetical protein QBC39DRAFT_338961 [Schizothecium conicum]